MSAMIVSAVLTALQKHPSLTGACRKQNSLQEPNEGAKQAQATGSVLAWLRLARLRLAQPFASLDIFSGIRIF